MLELKNIKKNYLSGENTVYALKGIDLTFRENEFVSILGQSGCGKTTLLNIIGGLDKYTEGDLIINGKSTKEYNARDWDTYRNHSIGFVFQSYNLIPHQDVLSNVEIALSLSGVGKRERKKRAIQALTDVGLGSQIHKKPSEMSGGQMQRVAIARALVNNPDIILADEPTGALDSETSIQVMEILKEVSKNRLVIMVTHNPDLASRYSTRVINMLDGIIKNDSNPLSYEEKEILRRKDLLVLEDQKNKKKEKKPTMSIFTALKLSLKNLITKKGRTIITSFAGSIGIIGIGLILSVSTGTNKYINTVQEESLSSYPLSIRSTNTDISTLFNSMASTNNSDTTYDDDKIHEKSILYNILDSFVNSSSSENDLKSFKTYLDKEMTNESSNLHNAVTGIKYSYGIDIPIYTKTEDGTVMESNMSKLVNNIFSQYASGIGSTTASGNDSNSLITSLLESTGSLTLWEELLPGINGDPVSDYVKNQYDVVYGTWPSKYSDIVVILNENNEIIDTALYSLGLKDQKEITQIISAILNNTSMPNIPKVEFTYEEICSKTYRTILAGDSYSYSDESNSYVDLRTTAQGLEYLYTHNGTNLNIVGVIKPKEGVTSPMLSGSIGYTSLLTKQIIESADNTEAVKAQINSKNIDILNNLPFKDNSYTDAEKIAAFKAYVNEGSDANNKEVYIKIQSIMPSDQLEAQVNAAISGRTKEEIITALVAALKTQLSIGETQIREYLANLSEEEIQRYYRQFMTEYVKQQYAATKKAEIVASGKTDAEIAAQLKSDMESYTDEQLVLYFNEALEFSTSTYEKNLIALGKVELSNPTTINIYTDSFANKDIIVDEIQKYNDSVEETKKIKYTDIMGVLMSAVNTIINAITYVLIAFVSISLIVSSIMIAIITLISVQERTKEIGILRAIGASKRNVSNMFNAETVTIGFAAGLIGVLMCYLFIIPINLIIHALTGITTLSASLPFVYALILILISVLLTVISGFIPSRSAAKKDPVVALRTE